MIEGVKRVAREQDATPAQVAISWLASQGHIVLLGARTFGQLEENLGALDVHLTQSQLGELDELTKTRVMYPAWEQRGKEYRVREEMVPPNQS